MEILLGAKKTFAERWDVHAGIGREVYHGLATPDFRIYAGLNLRIGPLMSRANAQEPAIVSQPLPMDPAPVEPPDEVITLYSLNFDTGKTALTKASEKRLRDNVANIQKKAGDLRRIVVEGHTDNVGTDAHNMTLSQGRAEAVLALLKQGMHLSDGQTSAVGRGESQPIASNDSAAGRAKNRRVELKIYRNK
jgi:outer membrane protein OmpA-like peptidoglycan-associated protein